MSRIRLWWRLAPGDRLRLPGLMLMLPLVSASLAVLGVDRARRLMEGLTSGGEVTAAGSAQMHAERLAWLVAIAGRRGLVHANCLCQSLLLYGLLRRCGHAPELKIGVRRQNGALDAHAWVDLEGVALGQPDLVHQPIWSASGFPGRSISAGDRG